MNPAPAAQAPRSEAESGLTPAARARGRRLCFVSHPAGMTHRLVYTEQLPTLALVALGASDAVVGLQRAFEPLGQILQLPTLRLVGRFRKRTILVAGQAIAVAGGLPLLAFGWLASLSAPWPLTLALASLVVTSAGIVVAQTVWFPLLRGYVESERIGHFFGILRSVWHLTLIAYFIAAQRWLAAWPGAFGALFGVATLCGLVRIALIARLPEAPGETGERVRVRESLRLLLTDPRLQRYLSGVALAGAARRMTVPFVIVMMRRVLGLSDADVVLATVAYFAGGFASLYLWGRTVDRAGPVPVFVVTGVGMAALYLGLLAVGPQTAALVPLVGFFFCLAVLSAGFGVADTKVLFDLAPAAAPTRLLVVADVTTSAMYGLAPLVAGVLLDTLLRAGVEPLSAYRGLFVAAAGLTITSLLPLRRFRKA